MNALRDYQTAALSAVRARFASGRRAVCLVMPTGAGKTRTCGEMVRLAVGRQHRVLWLAHRAELVDQAVDALKALGLAVGCESASAASPPQPFAPVQVATVQTLLARKRYPQADLIILDEAHHYVADEYLPFVEAYPTARIVGPTATPERSDGRGLGALFDDLVVGVRVRNLVAAGHLAPATIVAPADRLKAGTIAQRPVDAYLAHARGRRAIAFSPSVKVALEHLAELRAAGLRAELVTGETPWNDREARIADLRAGRLDVLCNVAVLTEGFDCPAVSCVILARSFGSAGGYLQAVGRALRSAPGKTDAIILDLVGASHVHGHPEDDRQYSLTGRGIRRDVDAVVDQAYCRVCGAPLAAGEACAECGTAPREQDAPRVTGEKLVPYARKRAEDATKRAETLRRWIALGAAKGYKPTWASAKFRAVYGEWPSSSLLAAAREEAA